MCELSDSRKMNQFFLWSREIGLYPFDRFIKDKQAILPKSDENAKSITKILCTVLIIFINEHDDDDDDGFTALPPQSKRIPVNSVNFQSGFRVSICKICY